jgi:hypothetical protein
MASQTQCRREIKRLHDTFVALYTGDTTDFTRVDAALAEDFEMVTPDGTTVEREAVLSMIRERADSYAPGAFDIEIRNVALVAAEEQMTACRYEEWQTTPDGEEGRVSTAVFRADSTAPGGLSWVSVHETWC